MQPMRALNNCDSGGMPRTAHQWTTAATIAAQFTKVRDSAICGVGMWGNAIHTGALIGKAIWKLRLALMAFS